jgi:hypothetical protein
MGLFYSNPRLDPGRGVCHDLRRRAIRRPCPWHHRVAMHALEAPNLCVIQTTARNRQGQTSREINRP